MAKTAPPRAWRITDAPPPDVHLHLHHLWRQAVQWLQEDLTDAGARPDRWNAAVAIYEAVYARLRDPDGLSAARTAAARGAAIEKLLHVLRPRTTPAQVALGGVSGIAGNESSASRVARWRAAANSHKHLIRSLEQVLSLIQAIRTALKSPGRYYGGSAAVARAPTCLTNPAKAAEKPPRKRQGRSDKVPIKLVAKTMEEVYLEAKKKAGLNNTKTPKNSDLHDEVAARVSSTLSEQRGEEYTIKVSTVRTALSEYNSKNRKKRYQWQDAPYQRNRW